MNPELIFSNKDLFMIVWIMIILVIVAKMIIPNLKGISLGSKTKHYHHEKDMHREPLVNSTASASGFMIKFAVVVGVAVIGIFVAFEVGVI